MSVGMNYEAAGLSPGILAQADTVEAALYWGGDEKQVRKMGGLISGSTLDLGNTPTDILRPGMLLGRITATKKLIQWDPTAVDGSENIYGVMGHDLKINLNGTGTDRFYGPILVGGPIKASAIFRSNATYGNPGGFLTDPYENVARLQMRGRFWFDDEVGTVPFTGWPRVKSLKDVATANAYQVLAGDNGTLFTNTGTGASQTVTLPAMTATPASAENSLGFHIGFFMTEAQDIVIAVPAGSTLYSPGSAAGAGPLTITGAIGQYIEVQGVFDKTAAKWLVSLKTTTATAYGVDGTVGTATATSDGATTGVIAAGTGYVTVTNGTAGYKVTLPLATHNGQKLVIKNGANTLNIIGVNGTIDGVAYGTGITVAKGTLVTLYCTDSTASAQVWVSDVAQQKRVTVNANVAVGGTAIGNANAVYEGVTIVTGADDTAAVILPVAAIGMKVQLVNTTAGKNLIVFPQVGSAINALGANNAFNSASDAPHLTFIATSATQWYTFSDEVG